MGTHEWHAITKSNFFFFLNKLTERGKEGEHERRQRERGRKREGERKTGMNE